MNIKEAEKEQSGFLWIIREPLSPFSFRNFFYMAKLHNRKGPIQKRKDLM
jgi:hypothetical protein